MPAVNEHFKRTALADRYTGFTRFGWRDYDPVAGRFMSVDPAKDLRGDADLYDYCADDPVNYVDREGTVFVPFLVPLLAGTTGALGLGLGGSYGAAKLADATQEARTGQPSTAARDGVKKAAGPTAVAVGMGTAGGALTALAPELLAEAMLNPNFATTMLDVWIAVKGPALPPPTTIPATIAFIFQNFEMFPEEIKQYIRKVQGLPTTMPHTGACTPQTQPRDKQGRFAPCEHSKP